MKRSERRDKFSDIEIIFWELKKLDKNILTLSEITDWLDPADKTSNSSIAEETASGS